MMLRVMGVLFLLLAPCWAQQPKKSAAKAKPAPSKVEEPPVVFPIEAIRVEGSQLYSQDKLAPATGLKIGEPGDKPTFERAKERLVDTGAFGSVGYRYEPSSSGRGYLVTFEVADFEQVYPYRLERLPAGETEMRAHLRKVFPLFDTRIPASKTMVDRYRKAIEEYLGAKNPSGGIAARITMEGPEGLYVMFYPAGLPPVVAEVRFRGNEVIPARTLQNTIHAVAVGVEYRENRFRELLDNNIRPLYEVRGRLRLKFTKMEAEPVADVKGLRVTVDVEEGPSYSLGETRVEGTLSGNEELGRVAGLQPGDLANFDLVKQAQERVQQAMRRNGYMQVTSTLERSMDDAKKTVDLVVHVSPGPEFHMGKLAIEGLDIHSEPEVRKMWVLKEGDRFNADYPNYFIGRLRDEQIFENLSDKTRSVVHADEKTLKVDVTLVFKGEAPVQKKRPPDRQP